MKTLEELKSMVKDAINLCGNDEPKFLSLDLSDGKARLHSEYSDAKNWAERGGQVLVLANDKVYTYKVKNDEEYSEYLRREIKKENYRKMNYYGI